MVGAYTQKQCDTTPKNPNADETLRAGPWGTPSGAGGVGTGSSSPHAGQAAHNLRYVSLRPGGGGRPPCAMPASMGDGPTSTLSRTLSARGRRPGPGRAPRRRWSEWPPGRPRSYRRRPLAWTRRAPSVPAAAPPRSVAVPVVLVLASWSDAPGGPWATGAVVGVVVALPAGVCPVTGSLQFARSASSGRRPLPMRVG